MRKLNQLKMGAILSYLNIGISCLIPILYTPVMLSILGQKEYGTYSLAKSVISYLSLLSFGMANSIVRFVTKYKCEDDHEGIEKITGLFVTIFGCLAVLVVICGIGLTFFSDFFFAQGLTGSEIIQLKKLMIIMTLSTAVTFPSVTYSALIIAYERYVYRRIIECVGTILPPILNIVILYLGGGSVGMALVGLLIQILILPMYIHYCHRSLGIRPRFTGMPTFLLKDIFSYTFFIFLSMIVDMMYWATDKVLIGAMLGTAAVAVYNIGGTFTSMLQNMATAISSVFVPRVMTMVEKNDPVSKMSELLIRVGRIQYIIVALILSGYIVFGNEFILFWAGESYKEAYAIALLTMIPLAIPLIQNVAYNVIVAENKHRFRAIMYAILAVINLVTTILAIPKFGIIGAAVCTSVAFIIGNGVIINLYYYKKIGLNIPLFWKNIFKLSIVPGILIVVGKFIINIFPIKNSVELLVGACIYTCVYGLLMLRVMNEYERDLILGVIRKMLHQK